MLFEPSFDDAVAARCAMVLVKQAIALGASDDVISQHSDKVYALVYPAGYRADTSHAQMHPLLASELALKVLWLEARSDAACDKAILKRELDEACMGLD